MSDGAEREGAVGTRPDGSGAADDDAYSGVFSAYPYALRASDSWLFRSYVAFGGLVAAVVVVLFAFALVELIADTTRGAAATFTFSRAFFVVLMALVVAPLVAPVLFVARRHRREGGDPRYDRALAAAGYLFVLALYVGLAVSVPPALQEDSPGAVGAFLYSLPRLAGAVPPLVGGALVYLVHRRYR